MHFVAVYMMDPTTIDSSSSLLTACYCSL